jgi:transcriptional regulator with XRE-family HTH domain
MTTATITGNERLRAAMVAANVTIEGLADHLGIDPKSVDRWLNTDRTPHARNAEAAAKYLGADAYHLWPKLGERHRSAPTAQDEVLACYPMRSTVPFGLWRSTLAGATTVIDLAVANLLFLADVVWDLPALLADKTAAGVRVRIVTPEDPAGPVTGLGDVFPSLLAASGLRLATHPGLRADVMRADDDLLARLRWSAATWPPSITSSPHPPRHGWSRTCGRWSHEPPAHLPGRCR